MTWIPSAMVWVEDADGVTGRGHRVVAHKTNKLEARIQKSRFFNARSKPETEVKKY
jgi:hypothetical protein